MVVETELGSTRAVELGNGVKQSEDIKINEKTEMTMPKQDCLISPMPMIYDGC